MSTTGVVRVAADLREGVRAAAARRGWTFSDVVHCWLEASLGLHAGEGVIIDGRLCTKLKRWRVRADSRGIVSLRRHVLGPLVAAAEAHEWPLSDEVNSRVAAKLEETGAAPSSDESPATGAHVSSSSEGSEEHAAA